MAEINSSFTSFSRLVRRPKTEKPEIAKVEQLAQKETEDYRADSDEVSGGSLSEGDDNGQRRSGSDNDQKRTKGRLRRQRRFKGGKKHSRKHHPYAHVGTSYADRPAKGEDADQTYTHAPRNTTQYLIEDHVKSKISPDLSKNTSPASNDEISTGAARPTRVMKKEEPPPLEMTPDLEKQEGPEDSPHLSLPFTASDRHQYDQEFVSAYDHVNEDKLYNMSKEELIRVTSRLLQKVGESKVFNKPKECGEHTSRREAERDRLKKSPSSTPPVGSCN